MSLVSINVYDITNTPNAHANEAIKTLNRFTRDTFGLGGIFHGAVEVNGEEWSFGYCPYGTGVYSCTPKGNPNYTFRESIPLGVTSISAPQFRRSIEGLQDEWQGWTYDLLSRNCNHFCEALVEILGVGPLPAWVNRFAVNADYALETSQTALTEVKKMWKSSTDSVQAATNWVKDRLPAIDPALLPPPPFVVAPPSTASAGPSSQLGAAASSSATRDKDAGTKTT